MSTGGDRGRAHGRALCVWAVAAILGLWVLAPARAGCPADRIDEYVQVRHVHDGDTVELADGRRVRFIGINTPELARDGRPAEPLAGAARDALKSLLKAGRLGLRYDRQRRDRYGRVLAHVYLDPSHSVTAWLLAGGYGAVIAVPPNLWNLDCYLRTEKTARQAGHGLWALDFYRPLPASRLPRGAQGFRFITGRVVRTGESRHSIWLNLAGGLALRIARKDLIYFDGFDRSWWRGRRVEARGWLHPYRGRPVMQIRHPFALRALPQAH